MTRKILVKVWEPLSRSLSIKLEAACMKRDPYLDKVFRREAAFLKDEVDTKNSSAARDYIARELGMLGSKLKPINLLLSEETADLIGEACELKNVPRDAFVNRTLLFLVVRPSFFTKLYTELDWDWAREAATEKYVYDEKFILFTPSMLSALGDIVTLDPFWYIRECINVAREHDLDVPLLHEKFIPREALGKLATTAIGFNCHVADVFVKDHPAARAFADEVRAALDELTTDYPERG